MKYLVILATLVGSLAHGEGTNFQDKVYPLLKKSPIHLILFSNFDFHPTYIVEQKSEKSHTITALVSYSPDDKGSISWSHFVTFHLTANQGSEGVISSIEFRDTGANSPCFMPSEVASIDELGNLAMFEVGIESQPISPQAELILQQFHNKTKKQKSEMATPRKPSD